MLRLVISLEENHFLSAVDFLETLSECNFEFFNLTRHLVRKLQTRWMMRNGQDLEKMSYLSFQTQNIS